MGFFKNLFRSSKEDEKHVDVQVPEVVDKPADASVEVPQGEALSIHKVHLDKTLINLSKGKKVDLTKIHAQVALCFDYSGSMDKLYYYGSVQSSINRIFPVALRFDNNNTMESWIFSDSYAQLDDVTMNNYANYVVNVIDKYEMWMGGTKYSPVLKNIREYYSNHSDTPAFVIFITDGENSDKTETENVIRELSRMDIFIQFIGIGDEEFKFLQKLDDLDGRDSDNIGFTTIRDMDIMSDDDLYTELLRQYRDWLNNKA